MPCSFRVRRGFASLAISANCIVTAEQSALERRRTFCVHATILQLRPTCLSQPNNLLVRYGLRSLFFRARSRKKHVLQPNESLFLWQRNVGEQTIKPRNTQNTRKEQRLQNRTRS